MLVTIGSQYFELIASEALEDFSFVVTAVEPTDTIDIRPSHSVCPKEHGWSHDPRRLGIKLYSLQLLGEPQPRPHA